MGGFQFSAVKAALVTAFGIAERDKMRFFARLEHWRRVGVIAGRPGKGTRIDYSREQIDKLTFLIQLSRFSIEPTATVELIKAQWDPPRPRDPAVAVQRGEASLGELFTVARESKGSLSDTCVTVQIEDFVSKERLPRIGLLTGHPKALEGFYYWLGDGQNSASVFNLSARLRSLDAALANPAPPPDPPGLAGEILRAGRRRRGEIP